GGDAHRLKAVLSQDGRFLAAEFSRKTDATVVLWDLNLIKTHATRVKYTQLELARLWVELADAKLDVCHRSACALARVPDQATKLLKDHMRPWDGPAPEELPRLVAQLDHSSFAIRAKATRQLLRAGEDALGMLCTVLTKGLPSLE